MVISNEDLLAAINQNTQEIIHMKTAFESIAATFQGALNELSNVKSKCLNLEKRNAQLENEIKILKRQARSNNFIIYKVPEEEDRSTENVLNTVETICDKLQLSLPSGSVNNCFRLGKGTNNRPILVSLNSKLLKNEIMKRKEDFAKINTPISQDRTPEDREYGRRIFNCLNNLRKVDKNASYYNKKFKLRGVLYTMEEAEEITQGLTNSDETSDSGNLKKSKQQKLEDFRFRPRTLSNTSTSSKQ